MVKKTVEKCICAAFLVFTFLFVSCDLFNKDVKAYLEKYTQTSAIEKNKVEESIGKSAAGVECIESNDDKSIELYLRNPQCYHLNCEYVFDHAEIATTFPDFMTDGTVTFTQAEDLNSIRLSFSQDFLFKLEKGFVNELDSAGNPTGKTQKDISGTIRIFEAETLREFEPYHLLLNVNSAPPRIRNAIYQRDKAWHASGTQYIICFNVLNLSGTVHEKDTTKLYVGSELYNLQFSSGSVSISRADGGEEKLVTSAPAELLSMAGEATVFENLSSEGYIPLYYKTGLDPDADANKNVSQTITLSDDYGFSKSVTISSSTAQLNRVTLSVNQEDNDSGEYYASDVTGTYEVTILHDGGTTRRTTDPETGNAVDIEGYASSAPQINYEVYKSGESEPVKSGVKTAPVTLSLEKGKYYIKAYASLTGYIDSKPYEDFASGSTSTDVVTIHRGTNYYVKSGASATGNGSKNNPYNSIQKCIEAVIADAGEEFNAGGYTINLQSNVAATSADKFDNSTKNALINFKKPSGLSSDAWAKFTINGNGYTIDALSKGKVINMGYMVDVILNDVTLTGGQASSGAGIWFGGIDARFTMNGGSMRGNHATSNGGAIYHTNDYDVKLNGVTITDNSADGVGGGIYVARTSPGVSPASKGKIILSGNCNITGNTAGPSDTESNIYLVGEAPPNHPTGAVIYIGENFRGSVGVTTENSPEPGHPITITDGFSTNCSLSPYDVFFADNSSQGGIIASDDGTEAVMSGSYAMFTMYDGETIGVTCTTSVTRSGTVAVTVRNSSNADVTSQCTFTNHMLLYMSDVLSGSTYYTPSADGKSVTLNSSGVTQAGNYALFVRITYKGFTYDATIPFAVN